jgi:membrane associated rhomboid family serine protease
LAKQTLTQAVSRSGALVGLMILLEALDLLFHLGLDRFGIVPRTLHGLVGVGLSPLLHAGAPHLFANAAPLFFLLSALFLNPRYRPMQTLCAIWIASGLGTWLIGRGGAVHIGASSLIYGLAVYLICAGWWVRSWTTAFISLAVVVVYGGIFYGVLPQSGRVSWEGHLAGAVAGWWVARRNLA